MYRWNSRIIFRNYSDSPVAAKTEQVAVPVIDCASICMVSILY